MNKATFAWKQGTLQAELWGGVGLVRVGWEGVPANIPGKIEY